MPAVIFYTVDVKLPIKNKLAVRRFVKTIFILEKKVLGRVNYIFCSDEYLLLLNRRFLNHNYYTDILTFDNSAKAIIVGEVYVSLDRIRDNAVLHNVSFEDELLRIIIHGVLHLCGHNDKSLDEKERMTFTEDFYLEKFRTFHVETK